MEQQLVEQTVREHFVEQVSKHCQHCQQALLELSVHVKHTVYTDGRRLNICPKVDLAKFEVDDF